MTALKEALLDAGYESPQDQLRRFAVEAWAKHPKSLTHRQNYVAAKLRGDRTWILMGEIQDKWAKEAFQYQAIAALLNRIEREIVAQRPLKDVNQKDVSGDQGVKAIQIKVAPTSYSRDTGAEPVGGGQRVADTQWIDAPATPSRDDALPVAAHLSAPATTEMSPISLLPAAPSKKPDLKMLADKHQARMANAFIVQQKLSKLDTVYIGTKRIGDCTVKEVREWAELRLTDMRAAGRDARFALSLVATLPSNAIIREWWVKPAEVDELYAKAEAENAA